MKSIMFYVNIISIAVALIFSIEFYLQINIFFAVFCITLEATKPIFVRRLIDKEIGPVLKVLITIICSISVSLSLLGCISNSSNLIQEDLKKQYKTIINQNYTQNNKNIKNAEENLKYAKENLNKYPDLNIYLSNLKSWENKSNKMTDWENNKKLLQDQVTEKENILDSLRKKQINKYQKIKTKSSGYSEMLTFLNDITGIKQSNIILILTIFMSLGLEIIILTSSLICKKDTFKLNSKISENVNLEIGKCSPKKKICSPENIEIDTFNENDQMIKIHENQGIEVENLKNKMQEMIKKEICPEKRSYQLETLSFDQMIKKPILEIYQSDHILNIDQNIKKIKNLMEKEFGENLPDREDLREKFGLSDRKFRKIIKILTEKEVVKRSKNGLKLVK